MNYNTSTSDYSSGCESGWTTYLDHNSDYSLYQHYTINHQKDDDDEDLSMVSDASSGPPLFGYALEERTNKCMTKSRNHENKKTTKKQSLCLDDTASSSVFHFSQDNVPPSDDRNSVGNVYSAAHFEGESITKKRLNFFKSSTKGKSGSLLGRKRQ